MLGAGREAAEQAGNLWNWHDPRVHGSEKGRNAVPVDAQIRVGTGYDPLRKGYQERRQVMKINSPLILIAIGVAAIIAGVIVLSSAPKLF